MQKRQKDFLRTIVAALRRSLAGGVADDGGWQRGDLDRALERLGIATNGDATSRDALPANLTAAEHRARYAADAALQTAADRLKGAEATTARQAARAEFVERAAYTWINRLLALRAMEARGLIDETLRTNPEYNGIPEALFVVRSDDPAQAAGADGGWWAVIEGACRAQTLALPGLFDLHDPAAALRPSTPALLRALALVGGVPAGFTLAEADAAFADPDAVGWAYQFYQEAAKTQVYLKLGGGGKAATRAEIAAATQLFTEPYMVQWLLQNSLGRAYHAAYPTSALPATWAYYLRERPSGEEPDPRALAQLDLLDPCCGSGHFLRAAFDMFVAMYREQQPTMPAASIADTILRQHLYGVDLDPRAAQLAALTLYLRAAELVHDERRRLRQPPQVYQPAALNLASTPTGLTGGALERHLRLHQGDRVLRPLLEGVFAALEQAAILGSLLRPATQLARAIDALQQYQMPMDEDPADMELRRTITELAKSNPSALKQLLLDRVAESFAAEMRTGDDVAAALFGREAASGVRLLQLLDRTYTIVVTNPPYMGSGNMDTPLKKYVEQQFKTGKRDLYAAFILRCLELCRPDGRVAMITQQSWMFLRSFANLRAVPDDALATTRSKGEFTGLLRETTIETLAHLGPHGFEEISGEVVQNAMFVLHKRTPASAHRMVALRLVGLKTPAEKARVLREAAASS